MYSASAATCEPACLDVHHELSTDHATSDSSTCCADALRAWHNGILRDWGCASLGARARAPFMAVVRRSWCGQQGKE
eukprot:315100-Chlamydomonas_euryale.AAC.6